MARRNGIEHDSTADRRLTSEDDAIAARCDDGCSKPELRVAVSRTNDAGGDVSRSEVNMESCSVGNRRELVEDDIEAIGGGIRAGSDESVAPLHLPSLDSR